MSDAERIAQLEERISKYRQAIAELGLAQRLQINLIRSLMNENNLERKVVIGERRVNAFDEFGIIFDRVYKAMDTVDGD